MDDTDQWVQYGRIHKTGVVVRIVNLQNIPHVGRKDTQKNLILVENQ
jgi:hypothetical protein